METLRSKIPTVGVSLPSQDILYPENHPFHNLKEIEMLVMYTEHQNVLASPQYRRNNTAHRKLLEVSLIPVYPELKDESLFNQILVVDELAMLIALHITLGEEEIPCDFAH